MPNTTSQYFDLNAGQKKILPKYPLSQCYFTSTSVFDQKILCIQVFWCKFNPLHKGVTKH